MKKVAQLLGFKMTKRIFANGVGKAVPILGGLLSGSLTYFTFKPSANRLQNYLGKLPIADVETYKKNKPEECYVEVDFDVNEDIEEERDFDKKE